MSAFTPEPTNRTSSAEPLLFHCNCAHTIGCRWFHLHQPQFHDIEAPCKYPGGPVPARHGKGTGLPTPEQNTFVDDRSGNLWPDRHLLETCHAKQPVQGFRRE